MMRGMGFRDFDAAEIERCLERERVVRIAFAGDGEMYLVPVFFIWHEGALCGLTTPGRKTRLAEANPRVAFQVDSSATTGPWEWSSVSGEGRWEVVASPAGFGPFAARLGAKLADSPEWAARLLQERFATYGMVAWRIVPSHMSGRAHGPE
jgi:nitroimidazol reductase NimA-like FMN-containing flavoprotein (pyridoxamine 5'-phosphate oxidase superfamily)